jgi:hypothetical protein
MEPHAAAAQRYEDVLTQVRDAIRDFEQQYLPDGRVDAEALQSLYDRTDRGGHPTLKVFSLLRGTKERSGNSTADTFNRAERVLRMILDRAYNTDQLQ